MTETRRVDGMPVELQLHRAGPALAVIFHGGHLRAELAVGQRAFLDAGLSVLQPSRPGYGATPLAAGPDDASFADRVATLCSSLGYEQVVACGVSAGGRAAMTFSCRHPDLVRGLVLESATSFEPWPDRVTRIGGGLVFGPRAERLTWATIRGLLDRAPDTGLRLMLGSLSTLPARTVIDALSPADRRWLIDLLRRMRSGRGFRNDLRPPGPAPGVLQPTLIVASRFDAAVGPKHPAELHRQIRDSRLVLTDALSHFLWIGPHADQEHEAVSGFLGDLGLSGSDRPAGDPPLGDCSNDLRANRPPVDRKGRPG